MPVVPDLSAGNPGIPREVMNAEPNTQNGVHIADIGIHRPA
jgi:hypothetical protein